MSTTAASSSAKRSRLDGTVSASNVTDENNPTPSSKPDRIVKRLPFDPEDRVSVLEKEKTELHEQVKEMQTIASRAAEEFERQLQVMRAENEIKNADMQKQLDELKGANWNAQQMYEGKERDLEQKKIELEQMAKKQCETEAEHHRLAMERKTEMDRLHAENVRLQTATRQIQAPGAMARPVSVTAYPAARRQWYGDLGNRAEEHFPQLTRVTRAPEQSPAPPPPTTQLTTPVQPTTPIAPPVQPATPITPSAQPNTPAQPTTTSSTGRSQQSSTSQPSQPQAGFTEMVQDLIKDAINLRMHHMDLTVLGIGKKKSSKAEAEAQQRRTMKEELGEAEKMVNDLSRRIFKEWTGSKVASDFFHIAPAKKEDVEAYESGDGPGPLCIEREDGENLALYFGDDWQESSWNLEVIDALSDAAMREQRVERGMTAVKVEHWKRHFADLVARAHGQWRMTIPQFKQEMGRFETEAEVRGRVMRQMSAMGKSSKGRSSRATKFKNRQTTVKTMIDISTDDEGQQLWLHLREVLQLLDVEGMSSEEDWQDGPRRAWQHRVRVLVLLE